MGVIVTGNTANIANHKCRRRGDHLGHSLMAQPAGNYLMPALPVHSTPRAQAPSRSFVVTFVGGKPTKMAFHYQLNVNFNLSWLRRETIPNAINNNGWLSGYNGLPVILNRSYIMCKRSRSLPDWYNADYKNAATANQQQRRNFAGGGQCWKMRWAVCW